MRKKHITGTFSLRNSSEIHRSLSAYNVMHRLEKSLLVAGMGAVSLLPLPVERNMELPEGQILCS